MSEKVYYIKGSKENPEGVRQALLDVCPNAENPDCLAFTNESGVYYVIDKFIHFSYYYYPATEVFKRVGIELQSKKVEKFVEKTMYSPVIKVLCNSSCFISSDIFDTKEEAMRQINAIGYQEVKVMIKE